MRLLLLIFFVLATPALAQSKAGQNDVGVVLVDTAPENHFAIVDNVRFVTSANTEIRTPDGSVVEFDAGYTEGLIATVMRQQFAAGAFVLNISASELAAFNLALDETRGDATNAFVFRHTATGDLFSLSSIRDNADAFLILEFLRLGLWDIPSSLNGG